MSEVMELSPVQLTNLLPVPMRDHLNGVDRRPRRAVEWYGKGETNQHSVAVLIPCYNEEAAIGKVVTDFYTAIPDATVFVYDNNSTDRTMEVARANGAVVRMEPLQGKGHVVRRMFADIDADVYVLVDGDDTYDANVAPKMTQLLVDQQLDMVTVARDSPEPAAYRLGHKMGNAVLTGMVRFVFGNGISDMLSGYRVFSRRFVKSFPALAGGFETETEFTVHALALNMPVAEVRAPYRRRPAGSQSKLNTFRDGLHILREIVTLIEHERPLTFFALAAAFWLSIALGFGLPVIIAFLHTGLVERLPTAVLSASLVLLASFSLGIGLILESVTRGRTEFKRLAYLAIRAP
jgi:glycosyltransferase involved in cell wall biosynthesis